jgi:histidinol-phosphate aminotransferase
MRLRAAVSRMKPYVPGKPLEEVRREYGLDDLVKLNQNENPLGPSRRAVRAAAEALGAAGHLYPEGTARAFRSRVAELQGLPGAEWVIAGNGSDELFRLLAEAYLEPGDRVVVPAPSFSYYRFVAELMGGQVVAVPLREGAMDLDAMAAAAGGARLLFLCRPNNPTGGVFAEAAFETFLEAVSPDCIVVLDEAYREFDETPFDARPHLVRYSNLVVTRTFSKIYGMAAFRLGYGMAQPGLLRPLLTIRDPFSLNIAATAAGLAALEDAAHLERSVALVREGKEFFYRLCRRLGLSCQPSQANFVLIDLGRPASEVAEALLGRGVIVRPCASFGLPTCIRVSVGLPDENRRFASALEATLHFHQR